MTKEQLEARICELDAQISRLDDERIAARQQLAEMQTDLKVAYDMKLVKVNAP